MQQLKVLWYYLVSTTIFLSYLNSCIQCNNIYFILIECTLHSRFQRVQVIFRCSTYFYSKCMKILVASAGYYVMWFVLFSHFVFVFVVMFVLGIVFWVSSVFGYDVENFYLCFPVLVLFWCCCVVLDRVACLASFNFVVLFLCDGMSVHQFCCITYFALISSSFVIGMLFACWPSPYNYIRGSQTSKSWTWHIHCHWHGNSNWLSDHASC